MFSKELKKILFRLYLSIPGNYYFLSLVKKVAIPSYKWRRLLRFKGPFPLSLGGIEFKLINYGNTIENELFWLGANGWEGHATLAWTKLSKDSSVIFDVGANTGLYSIISAKVNPSASIYAFEPLSNILARFKKNLEINNLNANVCKLALADENGEGKIFAPDTISGTFDQATLDKDKYKGPSLRYEVIEKKKLSTFIEENKIGNIDLMKIDVETYEPQVLAGMGTYLQRFAPTILIEILNDKVAASVSQLIAGIDYKCYMIDEKVGYIEVTHLRPKQKGNNFLLLNRSKHPHFEILNNPL